MNEVNERLIYSTFNLSNFSFIVDERFLEQYLLLVLINSNVYVCNMDYFKSFFEWRRILMKMNSANLEYYKRV